MQPQPREKPILFVETYPGSVSLSLPLKPRQIFLELRACPQDSFSGWRQESFSGNPDMRAVLTARSQRSKGDRSCERNGSAPSIKYPSASNVSDCTERKIIRNSWKGCLASQSQQEGPFKKAWDTEELQDLGILFHSKPWTWACGHMAGCLCSNDKQEQ